MLVEEHDSTWGGAGAARGENIPAHCQAGNGLQADVNAGEFVASAKQDGCRLAGVGDAGVINGDISFPGFVAPEPVLVEHRLNVVLAGRKSKDPELAQVVGHGLLAAQKLAPPINIGIMHRRDLGVDHRLAVLIVNVAGDDGGGNHLEGHLLFLAGRKGQHLAPAFGSTLAVLLPHKTVVERREIVPPRCKALDFEPPHLVGFRRTALGLVIPPPASRRIGVHAGFVQRFAGAGLDHYALNAAQVGRINRLLRGCGKLEEQTEQEGGHAYSLLVTAILTP